MRSAVAALSTAALFGCAANGPVPEVVERVEIDRYVGLWYEIASNPVFFNTDLVSVTAEYAIIGEGEISVRNTGRAGTPAGTLETIEGTARVVDPVTNAKLAVSFFGGLFGALFPGEYWIVLLDAEEYEYAVVTDSRQMTLFILYREPEMPADLYDRILADLEAKDVNVRLLRITGSISS